MASSISYRNSFLTFCIGVLVPRQLSYFGHMGIHFAEQQYLDYTKALEGIATPLAWLDLNKFQANAEDLRKRAAGRPIRLATKSIRCRKALRYVLEMDTIFQGLLCYQAMEAVWLSSHGFQDLVIAYPTLVPEHLNAVSRAVSAGAEIAIMTDCEAHLLAADQAARNQGTIQPVWIDLDCSISFPGVWFGVYRSPIRDLESLDRYVDTLQKCPNLRLQGLMGYEAQIAGVADQVPGRKMLNSVIQLLKSRSYQQIADRRGAAIAHLAKRGYSHLKVNGGGTGSLESTAKEPWVTELAAGSGLFGPTLFDGYRGFKPLPAVGFALEVCRLPGSGRATCLGGGYIASGAAGPEKQPTPYLPQGLFLEKQEMAGEVQTPLRGKTSGLKHGDKIFFRHAKAGELCEHFLDLHVIQDGVKVQEWATYRGEGQCFLG